MQRSDLWKEISKKLLTISGVQAWKAFLNAALSFFTRMKNNAKKDVQ